MAIQLTKINAAMRFMWLQSERCIRIGIIGLNNMATAPKTHTHSFRFATKAL